MKCVDSECQANAVCRHNKCTCKIGFVEIDGSCESEIYIFLYLLSGLCLNKKNRTEITYNFGVNFILKMDKAFIIFISEKCHSFNCPRFASCVNNKCTCNRGYVMIGERCEGMDTFKIVKQDSLFWFTCILNVNFFYLSQVLSINSHYLKNDW